MRRARLNYWIDVLMGVAFVASAISGMVYLLPLGFLSADTSATLGVPYLAWSQLHTWSSLGMIAAVGIHLVLHTKWIAAMTKKLLAPSATDGSPTVPGPRRRAIKLGGALLGLGALTALGAASLLRVLASLEERLTADGTSAADAAGSAEAKVGAAKGSASSANPVAEPPARAEEPASPAEQTTRACVACPHGLVNDPYPGRCRRYVDRNGDRICDLSVPQECG